MSRSTSAHLGATRIPPRYASRRLIAPARLLLALGSALLLVLGTGVTTAQAHDELVSSTPADTTTVAQVPSEVVLTFEEPPAAVGIEVTVAGPAGPAQSGPPVLAGPAVTQPLAAGLPPGRYDVSWRVTSDDGHPVSGTFSFTAQAGAATATATTATSTETTPTTAPTTMSPTTAATATPAGTASSSAPAAAAPVTVADQGNGAGPVVLAAVVVLLLLGGGAALLVRRRRQAG